MTAEVIEGDARELLPTLAAGSFDAVITDPPYWTLNKWRAIGTTTRLGGGRDGDKDAQKWFDTIDMEDLQTVIFETGRILKKDRHAWMMCDHETLPFILNYVRESGETAFGYCKPFPVLKMTKDGKGFRQGMGYHGRCSHEYVVLLEKGRRRFNSENWPDVFQIPWTGDAETREHTGNGKPYPTAKPLELFRLLLSLSTNPGERVLDPFGGSGTLVAAAADMDREGVSFDVSKRAIETANSRINMRQMRLQPVLAG
jgi:site-specific DNA-methyltransferase (adenine-specific)